MTENRGCAPLSSDSSDSAQRKLEHAQALLSARDFAAAAGGFTQAECLGANSDRCAGGRWMAAMFEGDFSSAWIESDAIRLRAAPDPNRFWNGEELSGARVMVRAMHGLGDAVQMLRYAPLLARAAAAVVYEVPPRLVELACCFDAVDQVTSWGEFAPAQPVAWDVQVEVMELPYLFRTTLVDLPVASRYLTLPAAVVGRAAASMDEHSFRIGAGRGERLRVGLAWAGGEWDPARSLPSAELGPLLEMADVEFWSLQLDPGCLPGRMHHAAHCCGDGLLALAATIANFDLILSIDSLAAHLAGAMGKPVWVMLQHTADWRWMDRRSDSPWYPSMRLFRQTRPGDWSGIVAAVVHDLTCRLDQLRTGTVTHAV